jgi:hypothetical protein
MPNTEAEQAIKEVVQLELQFLSRALEMKPSLAASNSFKPVLDHINTFVTALVDMDPELRKLPEYDQLQSAVVDMVKNFLDKGFGGSKGQLRW